MDAEAVQALEDLMTKGRQNGHITDANEAQERLRLIDIMQRVVSGDQSAKEELRQTANTFNKYNAGNTPLLSGLSEFVHNLGRQDIPATAEATPSDLVPTGSPGIFISPSSGVMFRQNPETGALTRVGLPAKGSPLYDQYLGGGGTTAGPFSKGIQQAADGSYQVVVSGNTIWSSPDKNAAEQVYNSLGQGPQPGSYTIAVPGTGKTYVVDSSGTIRDEIAGQGGVGGYSQTGLKDLEEAAKRARAAGNDALAQQYEARMQRILLGDQSATMSPGESARLAEDIRQFDLTYGLNREKFGQEKLQTQIQAARTAQPLTYLSLLRGAPQQYAGLGQYAPTLAQGSGAAAGVAGDMSGQGQTAQGDGVPMPPSMAAINAGQPIKQTGLPGGEGAYLRFEGPQAQRNLTPFELSANTEARAFQGIPEMDQEYQRAILRRGVGSGLRFGGYGGSLG